MEGVIVREAHNNRPQHLDEPVMDTAHACNLPIEAVLTEKPSPKSIGESGGDDKSEVLPMPNCPFALSPWQRNSPSYSEHVFKYPEKSSTSAPAAAATAIRAEMQYLMVAITDEESQAVVLRQDAAKEKEETSGS